MGSFIDRLFGRASAQSANVAKQRLQMVLIHDRSNLSEETLSKLKDAMIQVISQYVEIDHQQVEVFIERQRRESLLVANIPLATGRRSR